MWTVRIGEGQLLSKAPKSACQISPGSTLYRWIFHIDKYRRVGYEYPTYAVRPKVSWTRGVDGNRMSRVSASVNWHRTLLMHSLIRTTMVR